MEFLRYPKTIKDMAAEIKRLVDQYWSREISESDLKEALLYYAMNQGKKLFAAKELNNTIRIIIGSKRTEVVGDILSGFSNKQ